MAVVTIPYKPRYPEVHKRLEQARFSVVVAHRRFGKTVLAVNHLIKMALLCKRDRGSYAYIAPYRNQAKQIAWDYLKHYTEPLPGRAVNESELSIALPSGAKIRIFGADNPDALRGLYYDGVVMDEVAQMKPEVWQEIVQPALADRMGWALFIGTPKGINVFSELYYRAMADGDSGRWCAMSFPVTMTNALPQEEVDRLRDELSDNAWRQEMMCDFSASSDDVLIPLTLVSEAMQRTYKDHQYKFAPMIMGVDVARFGDDSSVIFMRRGLVAYEPVVIRKADNMELADRVAALILEHGPAMVCIDAGGGAGVIDRLRMMGHFVKEVPFGARPVMKPDKYVNRRAEMWSLMKEWLEQGGALPPHEGLKAELSAPTYSFDAAGRIKLEAKDQIKERLLRSPDLADALALTLSVPLATTSSVHRRAKTDYDLWSV